MIETIGIPLSKSTVREEWIDLNAHMNVAYYVLAFDLAIDTLWGLFGIDGNYVSERRLSTFAVESHVRYLRELRAGDPYLITSQILAYDAKRIHQFMRMYHATDGVIAATAEWLNLHVDLDRRRVVPWPDDVAARIADVAASQDDEPWPDTAGRSMRVEHPSYALGNKAGDRRVST
jgi:acyl-CoA thioester hydrolase